jgi:hypothetical protein
MATNWLILHSIWNFSAQIRTFVGVIFNFKLVMHIPNPTDPLENESLLPSSSSHIRRGIARSSWISEIFTLLHIPATFSGTLVLLPVLNDFEKNDTKSI